MSKKTFISRINKFLKKNILPLVVFVTGASVLVLETVAVRILSPYFGNTIFSFSSVVGVILAALSLGYWIGGNLADKNPKEKIFFTIIFLSGVSVFAVRELTEFFLPLFGYKLPFTYGPLVMSVFLFLVPSFLLGMLSPFAVKLQQKKFKNSGVGKISGEVFFFSTLGSIFGTFLTGFYLIPHFGVKPIVSGISLVLVAIGILGMEPRKKSFFPLFFFSFFSLFFLFQDYFLNVGANTLYLRDGIYEQLKVSDRIVDGKETRVLYQDRSVSSGLDLSNPRELAFPYTKYIDLSLLLENRLQNALFIGAGAFTTPRYLLSKNGGVIVDAVEVEPSLYEISKNYFDLKDDERLNVSFSDGRRFLHDSEKKYDLIFSDAYSSIYSVPVHMTTKEFFSLSKEKLTEGGFFIANIVGNLERSNPSLILSEMKTFKSVYPNSYFFAVDLPSQMDNQNIIFLGINSRNTLDFEKISKAFPDNETLSNLGAHLIDPRRFNFERHLVLTDDYSPVEVMSAKLLKAHDNPISLGFSGEEAIGLVSDQLSFGDRSSASYGNSKLAEMIFAGAKTYSEDGEYLKWEDENGHEFSNVFAQTDPALDDRILLATHFDTKRGVPGANDGASGVAVLLELMRVVEASSEKPSVGVDFVFFDGEEGLEDSVWSPIGSTHFTEVIKRYYPEDLPNVAIVLDMVCDKNLDIYMERSSYELAPLQNDKLFGLAESLYPDNFHKILKYSIEDDHTPLNEAGILSVLLIDFDYPYFHTEDDTLDKCSGASLEKVGNTLLKYLYTF